MGFFSWKTQDTNKSICNIYNSEYKTFKVFMLDDKGNVWEEDNYEGYGSFAGKDYYELLAEMNGLSNRDEGINLAFSGDKNVKYPNLVQKLSNWEYKPNEPENCEYQGFFY